MKYTNLETLINYLVEEEFNDTDAQDEVNKAIEEGIIDIRVGLGAISTFAKRMQDKGKSKPVKAKTVLGLTKPRDLANVYNFPKVAGLLVAIIKLIEEEYGIKLESFDLSEYDLDDKSDLFVALGKLTKALPNAMNKKNSDLNPIEFHNYFATTEITDLSKEFADVDICDVAKELSEEDEEDEVTTVDIV